MDSTLTVAEVAEQYARTEHWQRFKHAEDLISDVNRYLSARGLARSSISRGEIASKVLELANRPEPIATTEQTMWQSEISQGISERRQDLDDLAAYAAADQRVLEARVRAMSHTEFAHFRAENGIGGPDLLSFLGG